jgi:hypothetical protein
MPRTGGQGKSPKLKTNDSDRNDPGISILYSFFFVLFQLKDLRHFKASLVVFGAAGGDA